MSVYGKNYYNIVISLQLKKKKKVSVCQAGDADSVPGLGKSPVEGNGNPFQYSCLGNPMDRGTWWAITHSVMKRVSHDLAIKPPPPHTHTGIISFR